jgi:hypothetical protein
MPACGGALCVFNRNTADKLIHNCWRKNQQSVLGQFSIGMVGQFSISADMESSSGTSALLLLLSWANQKQSMNFFRLAFFPEHCGDEPPGRLTSN